MKHKGNKLEKTASLDAVYQSITDVLEAARTTAYRSVNVAMVQAYWQIGRIIVEEEQKGHQRADYGKALIAELARRLTRDYGKGFTESNLKYMRQFYLTFPNRHALRDELSWTHYRLLLKLEKEEARNFYQETGEKASAVRIVDCRLLIGDWRLEKLNHQSLIASFCFVPRNLWIDD